MVDKSDANFVTINFNYIFLIDFKYLYLSFNLIIQKQFLRIRVLKFIDIFFKKNVFRKKIYFTLKRQPIVSETDSFLLFLFYFKTFLFSLSIKSNFRKKSDHLKINYRILITSMSQQDAIYFISVKYCAVQFLSRRLIPRCPE